MLKINFFFLLTQRNSFQIKNLKNEFYVQSTINIKLKNKKKKKKTPIIIV